MTRAEKFQFAEQQLTNLTLAQYQEISNFIIWGPNAEFTDYIANAKIRYQNQASQEEVNLILTHMPGAGNNASKQFFADQALKKVKEDPFLKDAMNYLKV